MGSEPQSTDQTPDLIVVENVKQNDFTNVHFHNQAPSKIDSRLVVDRPLEASQAEPGMPVRVFQEIRQFDNDVENALPLRLRETLPGSPKTTGKLNGPNHLLALSPKSSQSGDSFFGSIAELYQPAGFPVPLDLGVKFSQRGSGNLRNGAELILRDGTQDDSRLGTAHDDNLFTFFRRLDVRAKLAFCLRYCD
jgi:hypothetical protein